MGIFKTRKRIKELEAKIAEQETIAEIKSPCEIFGHNWRDFPPFLEYDWNGRSNHSTIVIKEYYICTCCKTRQTKILLSRQYQGYDQDYFFNQVKELKEEYKDILKSEAIVEDMVNDAIMVDRQKLKYWDQLHAPEPPTKEPFELKIKETSKYEVKLHPHEILKEE